MSVLPYPHKIVLLRSGFRYPERHLFFARARLFFDRLELTGWDLNERHEEVIALDSVRRVEWQDEGEQADALLRLHLDDGREVVLGLSDGASWRRALELRLSWRPDRAPLAHDRQPASMKELIAYSTSMS